MTVFITGVGSGIGLETCIHFLSKGNDVIGLLRNKSQGKDLELKANRCLGNLHLVYADLATDGFLNDISKLLNQWFISEIDVLINIAGTLNSKIIGEFSLETIDSIMRVNFTAPALIIQELVPMLKKGSKANIINITSMSGFQGSVRFPGLSIYGASKAALSSLSESLSVELQEFNISVNALAIGSVNTNMLKTAFPDYTAVTQAEDMAEYIYNFATHGYKFYNGKTLPVAITNP
jgi:NAD(P)-dependent dehydrogenase (short-subunit alcohol dehydrogenase family)